MSPERGRMKHLTRESWLTAAAKIIGPWVEEHEGEKLPDRMPVIVSWPFGRRPNTIGVCYPASWTADEAVYVTVSPVLSDPVRVLATLLHELIHAIGHMNHGKDFRKAATGLGLVGKMKSTEAGEELCQRLQKVADKLGPYPHSEMTPRGHGKEKKPKTEKKKYVML